MYSLCSRRHKLYLSFNTQSAPACLQHTCIRIISTFVMITWVRWLIFAFATSSYVYRQTMLIWRKLNVSFRRLSVAHVFYCYQQLTHCIHWSPPPCLAYTCESKVIKSVCQSDLFHIAGKLFLEPHVNTSVCPLHSAPWSIIAQLSISQFIGKSPDQKCCEIPSCSLDFQTQMFSNIQHWSRQASLLGTS